MPTDMELVCLHHPTEHVDNTVLINLPYGPLLLANVKFKSYQALIPRHLTSCFKLSGPARFI